MTVKFRNVEVPECAPIAQWPYEAIVTLIERGTIRDWAMLTGEIDDDPWGEIARQVEEFLAYERPWGVAPLLERAISRARRQREEQERTAVAAHVRDLVDRSGLSMDDFARRIGTSRSRLSTYRSGRVVPSAVLVERMTHLARAEASASRPCVRPTSTTQAKASS